MPALRVKRGTRSQLDTAAGTAGLATGEPYLITDEGRLAVGTSASAYSAAAKQSEGVTVSATAPSSPVVNQLWLDIS